MDVQVKFVFAVLMLIKCGLVGTTIIANYGLNNVSFSALPNQNSLIGKISPQALHAEQMESIKNILSKYFESTKSNNIALPPVPSPLVFPIPAPKDSILKMFFSPQTTKVAISEESSENQVKFNDLFGIPLPQWDELEKILDSTKLSSAPITVAQTEVIKNEADIAIRENNPKTLHTSTTTRPIAQTTKRAETESKLKINQNLGTNTYTTQLPVTMKEYVTNDISKLHADENIVGMTNERILKNDENNLVKDKEIIKIENIINEYEESKTDAEKYSAMLGEVNTFDDLNEILSELNNENSDNYIGKQPEKSILTTVPDYVTGRKSRNIINAITEAIPASISSSKTLLGTSPTTMKYDGLQQSVQTTPKVHEKAPTEAVSVGHHLKETEDPLKESFLLKVLTTSKAPVAVTEFEDFKITETTEGNFYPSTKPSTLPNTDPPIMIPNNVLKKAKKTVNPSTDFSSYTQDVVLDQILDNSIDEDTIKNMIFEKKLNLMQQKLAKLQSKNQQSEKAKNIKRAVGDEGSMNEVVRPSPPYKQNNNNNNQIKTETDAERAERLQKGIQRLMHFVTIVGHVDKYLSQRFRNGVRQIAKLCESEEQNNVRRRRYSNYNM